VVATAGVKATMLVPKETTVQTHPSYRFPDGTYRFYAATFGSSYDDAVIVFRVRVDRDATERAREKGIRGYDRILEGDPVARWLDSHPGQPLTD